MLKFTDAIHNANRTVWVLATNATPAGERRCRHASPRHH